MKKIYLLCCAAVIAIFCGCEVKECQTDITFNGTKKENIPSFWNTDKIKYELSGGRSFSGDGVKGTKFSPENLKKGFHYIYYRDLNNFFSKKKMKIEIISLAGESVICNCDDEYQIQCNTCKGKKTVIKLKTCRKCGGDGKTGFFSKERCSECNGSGKIIYSIKCKKCKGIGKIDCPKDH